MSSPKISTFNKFLSIKNSFRLLTESVVCILTQRVKFNLLLSLSKILESTLKLSKLGLNLF